LGLRKRFTVIPGETRWPGQQQTDTIVPGSLRVTIDGMGVSGLADSITVMPH
jgi:hypothetical protein